MVRFCSHDTVELHRIMKLAREVERELAHSARMKSPASLLESGGKITHGLRPKVSALVEMAHLWTQTSKGAWPNLNYQIKIIGVHLGLWHYLPPSETYHLLLLNSESHDIELRAKGLCFRCKQPHSPLHECPTMPFQALIGRGQGEEQRNGPC